MLWNPLKIAASLSTPTLFRLISWGLAEITIENLYILGIAHYYRAYMHRIPFRPAAEKLLIAVKGVRYPHINVVSRPKIHELLSLACNKTTQYSSAVFLHRER